MLSLILLLAAQSDPLDELIRSSKELKSFSAVYELTRPPEPTTAQIRIDYVASAGVRVDLTSEDGSSSTACVDGVMTMVTYMDGKPQLGRVDVAALYEELAPTEKALTDAFPTTRVLEAPNYAVELDWSFDSDSQKCNYFVGALFDECKTPLGWLETLKRKSATGRKDGELLRFETDERYEIAISKTTGFLQEFSGTSPNGKLHIELVSLELDKDVDAARFVIPDPSSAYEDVSVSMSRNLRHSLEQDLRRRIYKVIADGRETTAWDDARLAKISSVLRPFFELTLPERVESWFEWSRKVFGTISARLQELRDAGASDETIEAARQEQLALFTQQIDEFETRLLNGVDVPESAKHLPRAAELRELEKSILAQVFQALVRGPALADFESATGQ